jgi:hypothetical protein
LALTRTLTHPEVVPYKILPFAVRSVEEVANSRLALFNAARYILRTTDTSALRGSSPSPPGLHEPGRVVGYLVDLDIDRVTLERAHGE